MSLGVLTMVIVIVSMDFFFWRPIVSWTSRFRIDERTEGAREIPFMELLLKESRIVALASQLVRQLSELKAEISKPSATKSASSP